MSKRTVLVIDDDKIQLDVAAAMLQTDYEVITAGSGKEALDFLHRGQVPHLVLLDILMPGMDGWDTFNTIRALITERNVPVVFMTSLTGKAEERHALDIGAADYIRKPLQRESLLNRVKKALTDYEAEAYTAPEAEKKTPVVKPFKFKKRLLRFLINIGTSGKYTGKRDFGTSDYLIRYVLMNFISIMGIAILAGFAMTNFRIGLYSEAVSNCSMIVIGAATFIMARTRTPQIASAMILMGFYGLLCIFITWSGVAHGANFVFIYMYPLVTIMLLGMRWGIILAAALVAAVTTLMLVPGLSRFDYHIDIISRMLASYFLVFAVMIVIETTRKTKDRLIEQQSRRLVELRNRAEQANSAKSAFLASMSHEIRTPMNAIIGIAQMQLQSGGLSEKQFIAIDKIYSSGYTLLGIINDILDLSKIETGKLELAPLEYDVPSLINDAVQLNIVRIGSKPIEFVLDIDENLPSVLFGDELRLKQVLNNLLSNAIKYTAQGSIRLSVTFETGGAGLEPDTITLIFKVTDTGQGMKQEDLSRLFSEYARFNIEANRTTEGTGLGLNITQKLVSMMGGAIGAESEYGRGSVFTVRVKQKKVNTNVIGAELAAKLRSFTFSGERQSAKIQFNREYMPYGKVLVVDDVETNLYVAEGLLSPYGLHIETVASGFAALDKVKSGNTYDIIFLDHMMPEMDGIQTCAKIRETGYTGVIAALTANAIAGNDKMFKEKGFDDFISKPIDIRQLDTALNKYVRDAHRDEAKKVRTVPAKAEEAPVVNLSGKLYEAFKRDAKKAAVALRETVANGDITLFTTTAHGMKTALASIGKAEYSTLAKALEEAGRNNDAAFITENASRLIDALESLLSEADGAEPAEDRADIPEDRAFLTGELTAVIAACGEYNDEAALSALDGLLARQWKPATKAALTVIKNLIFSDSDFDMAKEKAERLAHEGEVQ